MRVSDTYKSDHRGNSIPWDTALISELIENEDKEYLEDLYIHMTLLSKIECFIICRLIEKILGYNPWYEKNFKNDST